MKCLLVDNSNTRTKFALCAEGGEPEIRMMRTADITPESLCDITRGWHYDKVCICSVVPWAAQLIEQFCAGAPVIKPGPETLDMINFKNYPGMATLGADRMANAVRCPVAREIPENMKEKLDIYLTRKRANK